MRIGKYQFKPRLITSLLVLLLLPALISLGFWQLSRADQKRRIIAEQNAKMALAPEKISAQMTDSGNLQFRRLLVTGSFDNKHLIYIDNKIHQSRVGYQVVQPLRIGDSRKYVLVNRGWVPMGSSRANLPQIQTPQGEVQLLGIAKYATRDVVSFGDANRSTEGWPAVVRWIDIKALHKETGLDLLPFELLLEPASAHGFVREWTFINMPPEKHVSYAVQWFAMALALLVIYLVVNLKRIDKGEKQDD